jgi:hypothetical protein
MNLGDFVAGGKIPALLDGGRASRKSGGSNERAYQRAGPQIRHGSKFSSRIGSRPLR